MKCLLNVFKAENCVVLTKQRFFKHIFLEKKDEFVRKSPLFVVFRRNIQLNPFHEAQKVGQCKEYKNV